MDRQTLLEEMVDLHSLPVLQRALGNMRDAHRHDEREREEDWR